MPKEDIRNWERQVYNYLAKRTNGNSEVVKDVLEATKYFAKVKTREGNIFWVHSVNGHITEIGDTERMAQLQENFKRIDEDLT